MTKLFKIEMTKFILLLLFSNLIYSQSSGKAEYRVVIGKDSLYQSQEVLKGIYQDAMDSSPSLNFTLKFSNEEALFSVDNKISDYSLDFTLSMIDYTSPTYSNINTLEKIYESQDNEFLVTDTMVTDWKLTTETKLIDKYLCYKAVSEFIVNNPRGIFKFPIIAWYCPALPYSFGPIGYGKLPGLIVEFHRRNFVYGLKSISLNSEKIEIKKPSKGKKITYEKLNSKLIEDLKKAKEDFKQ